MMPFTFLIAPLPYNIQYIPQYSILPTYFSQNQPWNLQQYSLNSNSYKEPSKISMETSATYKPEPLEQKSQNGSQNNAQKDIKQNSVLCYYQKHRQGVSKKGQAKQKFGRNIMSNIFIMMVRFIHKYRKMRSYVQKIIQTYNLSIKINEFYNMIKRKMSKLPAYATQTIIKSFWQAGNSGNNNYHIKERQFSIIFRIIGKIYLSTYHMPYVYNTKKIKMESKKLHQIYIRTFLEF